IYYNCFSGDTPFDTEGNGISLGNNNIYQNPQFVDPNTVNFSIQATSPCRNAGDTSVVDWSTDLAGNPRVRENVVDIGAYEFQPGGGGPQGDVDGNGCVDDADLLQVLFAFGQTGSNPADVNGDSVVDDADLLIVLFNFGQGCGG
ncbi:MAG: hypothetical protein NZ556_00620, partial [Fimbriimonadales bacterium]|nr:hypothetical protein [Fimbriimonadales bacterium]